MNIKRIDDDLEEDMPDWSLSEWEQALSLRVGTAYVCRECGNVAMITRGGVGVMEMTCCGKAMDKAERHGAGAAGGKA